MVVDDSSAQHSGDGRWFAADWLAGDGIRFRHDSLGIPGDSGSWLHRTDLAASGIFSLRGVRNGGAAVVFVCVGDDRVSRSSTIHVGLHRNGKSLGHWCLCDWSLVGSKKSVAGNVRYRDGSLSMDLFSIFDI